VLLLEFLLEHWQGGDALLWSLLSHILPKFCIATTTSTYKQRASLPTACYTSVQHRVLEQIAVATPHKQDNSDLQTRPRLVIDCLPRTGFRAFRVYESYTNTTFSSLCLVEIQRISSSLRSDSTTILNSFVSKIKGCETGVPPGTNVF
jgi:hypothetical protein